MGVSIKKNEKGEYQLKSTVSESLLHNKEWVSEFEAKQILIARSFERFIKEIIEIDMEFPNGWIVNDKRITKEFKYAEWIYETLHKDNYGEIIEKSFYDLMYKKYKLLK